MKSSAFSGLSLTEQGAPLANGVDQRLFAPARERTDAGTLEATEQRANAPTLSRNNETTREPTDEPTVPRTRSATSGPLRPRSSEPTGVTADVATRPPAGPPSGKRAPARMVERHSHDIFQDQIRWMNRVKLDLEERYDVKVTGNAMVQLALDLFREDFIRNGEASSLIRTLVHGDPPRPETDGGSDRSRAGQEDDR